MTISSSFYRTDVHYPIFNQHHIVDGSWELWRKISLQKIYIICVTLRAIQIFCYARYLTCMNHQKKHLNIERNRLEKITCGTIITCPSWRASTPSVCMSTCVRFTVIGAFHRTISTKIFSIASWNEQRIKRNLNDIILFLNKYKLCWTRRIVKSMILNDCTLMLIFVNGICKTRNEKT